MGSWRFSRRLAAGNPEPRRSTSWLKRIDKEAQFLKSAERVVTPPGAGPLPRLATQTCVLRTNQFFGGTMKKRGRPRKNGPQPMWMLERIILALYAYDRARDACEKRSVAISEAVKYIRDTAPAMRVSETEVKRIITRWRSKQRATCLLIRKPDPQHSIIPLSRGRNGRILYIASIGPRPVYPRANAAAKREQTSKPSTTSLSGRKRISRN